MIENIKVGGTDAVSTTLSKTTQSVSSGLKRSVHRGAVNSVSDSTLDASTDRTFLPALANPN